MLMLYHSTEIVPVLIVLTLPRTLGRAYEPRGRVPGRPAASETARDWRQDRVSQGRNSASATTALGNGRDTVDRWSFGGDHQAPTSGARVEASSWGCRPGPSVLAHGEVVGDECRGRTSPARCLSKLVSACPPARAATSCYARTGW
jgi:hypothetical protein